MLLNIRIAVREQHYIILRFNSALYRFFLLTFHTILNFFRKNLFQEKSTKK